MSITPISYIESPKTQISKENENKNINIKSILYSTALSAVVLPAYTIVEGEAKFKDYFTKKGLKNAAKLGCLGGAFYTGYELTNNLKLKNKRLETEARLFAQSLLFASFVGFMATVDILGIKDKMKTNKKPNKMILLGLIGLAAVAPWFIAFRKTFIDMYTQKHANQQTDKTIDKNG